MESKKTNKWAQRGRIIWLFTKYQLLAKGLLALIIIPLFTIMMTALMKSSGRTNISSGDYINFFLSYEGVIFLLLTLLILTILIGIDINAFIVMTALIHEGKVKMTARSMIFVGIKSLKLFLKPSGILLFIYIAIIVPLVGIGISVSPMQNFQIPNFITSVIFDNSLYLTLYLGVMLILSIVNLLFIFSFHYIILLEMPIKDGLKSSLKLMKKHWRSFIKDFLLKILLMMLVIAGITVIILAILLGIVGIGATYNFEVRELTIFTLLSIGQFWGFVSLISVPVIVDITTNLFYKYNQEDGNPVKMVTSVKAYTLGCEKYNKVKVRTKVGLGVLLTTILGVNFLLSIVISDNFNEIFKQNMNIEVVAHRAGGDLGAENTIQGLDMAIKNHAKWAEIDVQRTKDGQYIINHDSTFSRLSGVSKSPSEMYLDEIKKLEVENSFDPSEKPQPVATLEEFLDAAKNKIGLFIELKGETADKKMVNDVMRMIKEKNMVNQTVILSLDYPLIEYVKDKYPEEKTGYLYFFSFGNPADLKSDYLIMEEGEATYDNIELIHEAGKKVIVWTVNTPESIDKFTKMDVDGIITDHVKEVNEGLEKSKNRSDVDKIIDSIFY